MIKKLQRWLRTLHTVRHLRLRQACYFFLRRGIGARRVSPSTGKIVRRVIELDPVFTFSHSDVDFVSHEFSFLNNTVSFPRGAMNWQPREPQRLWRYNLHYFDFLLDEKRSLHEKITLIEDWIANNPQGSEPAWEPYTASLRIVNWCRFFWSLPQETVSDHWLQSLNTQVRWLEKNLELHILANHYFENIKAMLFAGMFFDDRHSARWLRVFQVELIRELHEQTLSDGGHYERSPQYHCILLEGYLDLHALLHGNTTSVDNKTLDTLTETINNGLRFLATIATPDDDIPLFNDSASGTASRPSVIFDKARQRGFAVETPRSGIIDLPDSGLFGWKSGDDYFLIDCGAIGPVYQPGHTHCDLLSFVLMLDRRWVVVDSGVCEYEPGPLRQYVRSTAAHNTVTIDDHEQSEIWGEFRVGRRARVLGASIKEEGYSIVFEGEYRGFPTIAAGVTHRRRAVLHLLEDGRIRILDIEDIVEGRDRQPAYEIKTLLHLHPDLRVGQTNPSPHTGTSVEIMGDQLAVAILRSPAPISMARESSWFCPEFGLHRSNIALLVQKSSRLPARLNYRLEASRTD